MLTRQFDADVAHDTITRLLAMRLPPKAPLHWARRVAMRISIDRTRREYQAHRRVGPSVTMPEQEVLAMARECLRALPRQVVEDELTLARLTNAASIRRCRAVKKVKKGEYL